MRKAHKIGLMACMLGSGFILAAAPASAQTGDAGKCAALAASAFGTPNVTGATSATGKWVEADTAKGLPAYCEVAASLSPVPASKIGVVYRLPANWNGKLLGLGGGGWAGNITLQSATAGLKAGFATAQTDGGHPSTSPWDTSWTGNPEAVSDFAYRAINQMTVAGKALVKSFYGSAQKRAYFHGCSTGGRMALMEAQRFPEDYDAIIAEAPVYSLQVQTSAVLRNKVFAESGGFNPAQLKLVNDAVLKACDAKDGVTDGVIAAPRACAWSPKALACPAGAPVSDSCISGKQAAALETLYSGIKAADGSYAMLPLSKGGETGWGMFITTDGTGTSQASGGGMPGLLPLLFGARTVDLAQLTPAQVLEARSSAFAKDYEATKTDLKAFFSKGGKLLLWHGESDPGPSPDATADYYRAVLKGGKDAVRLFMAPGVGHCRGGPGADLVDNLATLDSWVETGKAPTQLIATRADGKMTRPLCVFPQVARFKGAGDANDPKNYVCEVAK